MPSRVQYLSTGLSLGKQADIATAASSFWHFRKITPNVTTPKMIRETDAAEIGKGAAGEFITETFPSHIEVKNTIEKYASSEWVAWVLAYGLGKVTVTGTSPHYTYNITPINPWNGDGLELPYFSLVEQCPDASGAVVDNLFVGNSIESWTYAASFGPGRASSKMTCEWDGSGIVTSPSVVTLPTETIENNMLAASATLTVNGVDYVGSGRFLSANMSWKSNILLNQGYFPGSGMNANGFQTRGRQEIGSRACGFQFVVRAASGSTEANMLATGSTGSAVYTVQHDANNSATFTYPAMQYSTMEIGESDGLLTYVITGAPNFDPTSGTVFSATVKTTLGGIAQ